MIVKICGIRNLEELDMVERYADAAGVVVRSPSRRCVELDVAKEILASASLPVFVVSTICKLDEWLEIVGKVECGLVQVHADMPLAEFDALKDHVRVMKAFIVGGGDAVSESKRIMKEIETLRPHFVLLDSGAGEGRTHNWEVSRIVAKRYGIFLAGGLKVENVCSAVKYVNPIGVDVSSGVELSGAKNERLVAEFVRRAKNEVRQIWR